jgi:HK97 family phage major capsid protein
MSSDLRTELKRVEGQLSELRTDRAAKLTARNEAREKFLKLPEEERNSPESEAFKTVEAAVADVGTLDDKMADLQKVQVGLLKALGEDDGPADRGSGDERDAIKGWLTDEHRETLKSMAGSRGRFGNVDLGEAFSRDELVGKADLAATAATRRATLYGVVPLARRRLSLLDLIPTGTMDGNSLPYVQEGGSYAAAETTEGAVKPEAGVTLTDATADAATIAHWKKIQKQSLEDFAALRTIVDSHLRYGVLRRLEGQILVGNGTAPNLRGIRNTTNIQTQAYASEPIASLILRAIAKVFIAEGEADATVLNPADWASALLERDGGSTGPYLAGGPGAATDSPGFNTPTLWGVPLLANASQTAGFATVGDFAMGATLFIRSGINVLISDSDQDDFIRNRVTLLGEMRARRSPSGAPACSSTPTSPPDRDDGADDRQEGRRRPRRRHRPRPQGLRRHDGARQPRRRLRARDGRWREGAHGA